VARRCFRTRNLPAALPAPKFCRRAGKPNLSRRCVALRGPLSRCSAAQREMRPAGCRGPAAPQGYRRCRLPAQPCSSLSPRPAARWRSWLSLWCPPTAIPRLRSAASELLRPMTPVSQSGNPKHGFRVCCPVQQVMAVAPPSARSAVARSRASALLARRSSRAAAVLAAEAGHHFSAAPRRAITPHFPESR